MRCSGSRSYRGEPTVWSGQKYHGSVGEPPVQDGCGSNKIAPMQLRECDATAYYVIDFRTACCKISVRGS